MIEGIMITCSLTDRDETFTVHADIKSITNENHIYCHNISMHLAWAPICLPVLFTKPGMESEMYEVVYDSKTFAKP